MGWWQWLFGRRGLPANLADRDAAQPAEDDEIVDQLEIPIDGVLDLHTFRPADVKRLVTDYVVECHARGICQLRIIHGKGKGVQRRTVHAVLQRLPQVERFSLAGPEAGGWGATVVTLKSKQSRPHAV